MSGDGPWREPDPRSVPDRGGIDANESDRREAREGCDALVVVDVQQGFDDPAWGERNNPDAEERIARLLDFWRASDRPIVHLRHDSTEFDSPLRPDRPGNASKPEVEPKEGEAVLGKEVNSGFVRTDLEARLHGVGAERVTLVGLTTDHCVSTTARTAANLGFETVVVTDATATFDREGPSDVELSARESHDAALAHLHEEFASIVDTADLL